MPNEHLNDEDDIGSGERSPGAKETEKEISKISKERPDIDKEDKSNVHNPSSTTQND